MQADRRGPSRPPATLTVEASATIEGREVLLDVGVGRIVETAEGKKLCMRLGAVPDDRTLYVSMRDVLRLEAEDDAAEFERGAVQSPLH